MKTPIHKLISEHLRITCRGKKRATSKSFIDFLVKHYGHLAGTYDRELRRLTDPYSSIYNPKIQKGYVMKYGRKSTDKFYWHLA